MSSWIDEILNEINETERAAKDRYAYTDGLETQEYVKDLMERNEAYLELIKEQESLET